MTKREKPSGIASRMAAMAATVKVPPRASAAVPLPHSAARPGLASPHEVLSLQQRYGNRAVQRWLSAAPLQAKLTVGAAGDHYEREADRVADEVAGALGQNGAAPALRGGAALQRPGEDEARVQRQPLAASITRYVQRQAVEDDELKRKPTEDDELQRKPMEDDEFQRAPDRNNIGPAGGPVGHATGDAIEQARGGGQGLPNSVRGPMENAFGADFSGVKVHTDRQADTLNRSIQARAFTTGRDVFFRQGEFSPTSHQGQKLLAHELTHVVQQGGGTLRRALNDDTAPPSAPPVADEAPDLQDAQTGKRVDRLQPGDVLLLRGGHELAGDLTQFGQYLNQQWSGKARGANSGFPDAGLFLGGGLMARSKGMGVTKAPVKGDFYVYRCRNRALADEAARLSGNWSVFHNSVSGVEGKYSNPRAFDALAHSSKYNRSRAIMLAAFFLHGASAINLFCSDFAIACFQGAALLDEVEQLKQASPPPAPAAQDNAAGRPKTGLAALPSGPLKLDPRRIRDFQLASEMHRLSSGDSPRWELAGVY